MTKPTLDEIRQAIADTETESRGRLKHIRDLVDLYATPDPPPVEEPPPPPPPPPPLPPVAVVIAQVTAHGTGAPAGTITTGMIVLPPGALPAGRRAVFATPDGRRLPCTIVATNDHPDGSASMLFAATWLPEIAVGARLALNVLQTDEPPSPPALMPSVMPAVTLTFADRAPWAVPFGAGDLRVDGSIVRERRYEVPVPKDVCGVSSARVVVDVQQRADGTMWSDVWVRNDGAMKADGGKLPAYVIEVVQDDAKALMVTVPLQIQYAGFGRLIGTKAGGIPAPRPPILVQEMADLVSAGATARYDVSLPMTDRYVSAAAKAMALPSWGEPLNHREITRYMPQTGGRSDIGPLTRQQAGFLCSRSLTLYDYIVGQAEAIGACPWHFWIADAGTWLSPVQYPTLWVDARGGVKPPQLPSTETGWTLDTAHHPNMSFLPFLLTGRRAFLENLQAQAAACIALTWPAPEARGRGAPNFDTAEGVNVVRNNQVRGGAWSLRSISDAWFASPTGALRDYYGQVLQANVRWLNAQATQLTAVQGEAHGYNPASPRAARIAPWQQDYLASSLIAAARRGVPGALDYLTWASNFLVGRFVPREGWSPRDGIVYQLDAGPADLALPRFQTWAEMGASMRARGASNALTWAESSKADYGQLALATLAGLSDLLPDSGARERFDWLRQEAPPFTFLLAYQQDALQSIVPKDFTRATP